MPGIHPAAGAHVLHYFLDIALDGYLEMEAERRQAELEAREAYREEYEADRYE